MWEKQLLQRLCTKYKHSTFLSKYILILYSGWSLANLVSLAYSSEWEVKICFLRAKKKLRQPSKGFWLSIIEHNNFEISASKFCAHYVWHFKCAKLKSKFFVGKLTIHDEHKKSFFNLFFCFICQKNVFYLHYKS